MSQKHQYLVRPTIKINLTSDDMFQNLYTIMTYNFKITMGTTFWNKRIRRSENGYRNKTLHTIIRGKFFPFSGIYTSWNTSQK